ncbi:MULTISPECIES: hypothetical protein, partial [Enterobacteriaceae]
LMMSLWDALRMNMMISYQELVRTFPKLAALQRTGTYPNLTVNSCSSCNDRRMVSVFSAY